MGLAADLDRIGYHMRDVRVVGERGERVAGFGTRVFGELAGGRYVTLGRSDLSRLSSRRPERRARACLATRSLLLERADGVQVRFERYAARKFDLVIGADGLHSTVRALSFGPHNRFERSLGYRVAAFETRGYRPRDEEVYVLHCAPGRMLERFALADSRPFAATLDLAAQKAILCREFGHAAWETPRILEALEGAQDLYFDRVSQIRMNRWSRGRVTLVGDAAFCVSLMAGQGSALAMTAAYVLAGELAQAEGQYEPAFSRYEGLLRSFIECTQRGAESFAAAFAPRTRWGLLVRNQVMNAFAIPALTRFVFGREIADQLPLREYDWPASAAMGGDGQATPDSRSAAVTDAAVEVGGTAGPPTSSARDQRRELAPAPVVEPAALFAGLLPFVISVGCPAALVGACRVA